MRKSIFLALGIALLLTGCATQQAAYGGGYAGGYYLGDCAYEDICGPGLYGTYFYYTPFFPAGPLSPERLRVDLTASRRTPRVVGPRGISRDPGGSSDSWISSGSSGPSAPASVAASVPVPPPPPPAVHTVAPR
jgi:putative VirB-like lipoprotein